MTQPTSASPRIVHGLAIALLCAASVTGAHAADAPARNPDPLETMNRGVFRFNRAFDKAITRPIAEGYRAHVPVKIRQSVSNFVANLEYPIVIVNDALQLKLHAAGTDVARFAINTVVGVGGFGDPATRWGLPVHDEDFGQTLGYWGLPPGPYLVLPFIGPSDLRDAPGRFVDTYTNPEFFVKPLSVKYGLVGVSFLDARTEYLATDDAVDGAFDPYILVRNAYLERRYYVVHDGNIPEPNYDDPSDPSNEVGGDTDGAPDAKEMPKDDPN